MSEIIKYAINEDTVEKSNKYHCCPVCGGKLENAKYQCDVDRNDYAPSYLAIYENHLLVNNECYYLKRCNRCGLVFAK